MMTFPLGLGHAGAHLLVNTQKHMCSRQPGTFPQTSGDQYPWWQHQDLSCSPAERAVGGGRPQKVGSLAPPCSQPQVCPAVLDQRKGFSHSQSPRPSEPSLRCSLGFPLCMEAGSQGSYPWGPDPRRSWLKSRTSQLGFPPASPRGEKYSL